MAARPNRLLCLDLQVDPALGLEPDPHAIFGARQLLTLGRRLGWSIAHARRRSFGAAAAGEIIDSRIGAMRARMSERVFFRPSRSIADSRGLTALLEGWRGQTVLVAAFDHVALLSCLLACHDQGPRLVLVEDALSLRTLPDTTSREAFVASARRLAAGAATLADIMAEATGHPPTEPVRATIGGGRLNIPA
jgi:hypothetical protein